MLLDLEVQRTVRAKAGGVVHFQQPGAALVVQQDVVPQQLEAGKAFVIWWPYRPAGSPHSSAGLAGKQERSQQAGTRDVLQAAFHEPPRKCIVTEALQYLQAAHAQLSHVLVGQLPSHQGKLLPSGTCKALQVQDGSWAAGGKPASPAAARSAALLS